MKVFYSVFFIAWGLIASDVSTAHSSRMSELLEKHAACDELFKTISPSVLSQWPSFKIDYLKKTHLDEEIQVIDALCKVRLTQSILTRASLKLHQGSSQDQSQIIKEINAMQRKIRKDKEMAELCYLTVGLQAKMEFLKHNQK
jgi:hypothetical protein